MMMRVPGCQEVLVDAVGKLWPGGVGDLSVEIGSRLEETTGVQAASNSERDKVDFMNLFIGYAPLLRLGRNEPCQSSWCATGKSRTFRLDLPSERSEV